jgi:hypothetical protein
MARVIVLRHAGLRFAAALACATAPGFGLRAQILYQTYDGTSAGSASVDVFHQFVPDEFEPGYVAQRIALAFTTGPTGWQIDHVVINLSRSGGDTGAFALSIRDDNPARARPGTVLETLANPGSIDGANSYTFTSSGLVLASNTKYWVVAEPSGSGDSRFTWYAGTASGLPSSGYLAGGLNYYSGAWNASWTRYNTLTPSIMVSGTLTAIPEPTPVNAAVATLLYAAGLSACRRRCLVRRIRGRWRRC